jgi:hypothetical protein
VNAFSDSRGACLGLESEPVWPHTTGFPSAQGASPHFRLLSFGFYVRRVPQARRSSVTRSVAENSAWNQPLTLHRRQNRPIHVPHLSRNEIIATNPAPPDQRWAVPQHGHCGSQPAPASVTAARSPGRKCFTNRFAFLRNPIRPSSPRQSPLFGHTASPKTQKQKSKNAERSEPNIGKLRSPRPQHRENQNSVFFTRTQFDTRQIRVPPPRILEPRPAPCYTIGLCQRYPPPGSIITTIGRSVCGGSWLNSIL